MGKDGSRADEEFRASSFQATIARSDEIVAATLNPAVVTVLHGFSLV